MAATTPFRFLTSSDRELLLEKAQRRTFTRGTEIVAQGTLHDALFIVRRGAARVEATHLGRGVAFARLGPGSLFGEMAFLHSQAASASVVADTDVEVDVIDYAHIHALNASVPGFSARLYQSLAETLATRLRDSSQLLPPLLIEHIPQVDRFHTERTGHMDSDEVPDELAEETTSFREAMAELKMSVTSGELTEAAAQARVNDLCDGLMEALTEHGLRDPEREVGLGSYVFREAFPILMSSRFIDRAYSKPRGFSGDFETLGMIFDNEPRGDSVLGALVDSWALQRPFASAVRDRSMALPACIRSVASSLDAVTPLQLTGLGVAEAGYLVAALGGDDPLSAEVTLIDVDPEALAATSAIAASHGLEGRISLVQDHPLFIARGLGRTALAAQQAFYCLSLADYLSDDDLITLLDWVHESLTWGGTIVLGAIHVPASERAFLDHILGWRIEHRSSQDLQALLGRTEFHSSQVETFSESESFSLISCVPG